MVRRKDKDWASGDATAQGGAIAVSGIMYVEKLIQQTAPIIDQRTPEQVEEALRVYAGRVRETYGRLDVEVLTPPSDRTDRDPHVGVDLRRIFVPQGVRAHPPPRSQPSAVEAVLDAVGDPRNQHLVLLGDPGAGKSILARYLALSLTGGTTGDEVPSGLRGRLPLVVELRRYARLEWRNLTFKDFLDHLHKHEGLSVPPKVLLPLLETGRVLVIFDGLDELVDQDRDEIARRIANFASLYQDVRVIVTSRIHTYKHSALSACGFRLYLLRDFTEEQVQQFIHRWYTNALPNDREQAEHLAQRVTDAVTHSRPVRDLAGNPLLLTILAITGRSHALPRNRRELYAHAVSVLVDFWDRDVKYLKPHVENPEVAGLLDCLRARELMELLRLLARRMYDGGAGFRGNHISEDEIREVFRDFLTGLAPARDWHVSKAAEVLLRQMRLRNFILDSNDTDDFGFVHRTILEYLVASDMLHRHPQRTRTPNELVRDVFRHRVTDSTWHEVLLLVVGQLDPDHARSAIDHVLDRYRERDDDDLLGLAIRALAEVGDIGELGSQSENAVDALTHRLTYGSRLVSDGLMDAAPAMGTLSVHWTGRPRYLRWFHLYGQFLEAAALAATFAAYLYRSSGTVTVLLDHGAPPIRAMALRWLAQHQREDARDLVWERATGDPQWTVRHTALELLVEHWPDGATRDLLRERTAADPDEFVRSRALRFLDERWPDSDTPRPVGEPFAEDPRPTVRVTPPQFSVELPDDGVFLADLDRVGGPPDRFLAEWPGEHGAGDVTPDRVAAGPDPRDHGGIQLPWSVPLDGTTVDGATGVRVRDRMLRQLRDPRAKARVAAAWMVAFGWYGDDALLGALRTLAREDGEAEVRVQATGALAAALAMRERADHEA